MPSIGNINKNYPHPVLGNLNDFDAELNTHLEEYLITRREKSLFDDKNSTAFT